jgi:hypothetical protein
VTGAQSSAAEVAEPQEQADTAPTTATKPRSAAEGKCRVPKCTDEQLQGGVCARHFLEGRHVR